MLLYMHTYLSVPHIPYIVFSNSKHNEQKEKKNELTKFLLQTSKQMIHKRYGTKLIFKLYQLFFEPLTGKL